MPSLAGSKLTLADAPHLHREDSAHQWLWGWLFALLPALILNLALNGLGTVKIFLLATVSAVGFESIFKPRLKIANAIYLAVVLTLLLPRTADWRMALISSFVAVAVAREFFGGFGQNIFHPALAGLAVSFYFFPGREMSTPAPDLFSAAAVWVGGLFLIFKKWARWEIPLFFFAGAAVSSLAAGSGKMTGILFSETLVLGAFFLAADIATAPITKAGRMIFAASSGMFTVLLSQTSSPAEALVYSLLIMNAACALLDSAFRPRRSR